ncbi:MAG: nuclease-related domain-containing protein [Paenisporosarcina sp.]
MILKKRSLQLNFLAHEAILKRLDIAHPSYKKIEQNYQKAKAGVWGEEVVDAQLANYRHPFPHLILHDIHLRAGSYFQVDNLFITQSFILVIEVKNIKGRIELKQNPYELIRNDDTGEITHMDSPEEQLEKNMQWLEDWLSARQWNIPVNGIIVFANPDAVININHGTCEIVKTKYLTKRIRKMDHSKKFVSEEEMLNLGRDIVLDHANYQQKCMIKQYSLLSKDVKTGVECPVCHEFGMKKEKRNWVCSQNHRSSNAHVKSLEDYFFIFGPHISNKESRRFLHIESTHVAKRLLKNMNLLERGKLRYRIYEKVPSPK